MSKQRLAALRTVRPEVKIQHNYAVQTVRALPGGKFLEGVIFQCGSDARDAKSAADRMQREFDEDCDPCRTYVLRGNDRIPMYAGLQRQEYGGYRG
jgi:hypothetical protein